MPRIYGKSHGEKPNIRKDHYFPYDYDCKLPRCSKACQVNLHGACRGYSNRFKKCTCPCHTSTLT